LDADRLAACAPKLRASYIREKIYEMNGFGFLETTWQDLRYSLRAMRKNPAFAVAALLTVGLGIGGNTAIFTVIRSVLLQPLNYGEPDRLVYLSADNQRRDQQDLPFTEIRLEEMRSSARSFSGIGAFLGSAEDVTLSGAGEPEALKAARVSGNFLKVLAVQPRLGRSFLPEEDTPRGSPVAMISARLWQRRFGSDPLVIGKTVILNAIPHAIVGVLPANFSFPFSNIDVWVPRPSEWSRFPARYWRTVTLLKGFARLKPRVSLQEAAKRNGCAECTISCCSSGFWCSPWHYHASCVVEESIGGERTPHASDSFRSGWLCASDCVLKCCGPDAGTVDFAFPRVCITGCAWRWPRETNPAATDREPYLVSRRWAPRFPGGEVDLRCYRS
jgi:hypothetical protein